VTTLKGNLATAKPASDIFVINSPSVNNRGITRLVDLMGSHGLLFYKSSSAGKNKGPGGLIARDDTLVIKVNSQWDERGGTNTDLLKSLIQAIVSHPDGFTGEVVVADNGQYQYGSAGKGGNLDWIRNNAEDISQSVQKVIDSFSGHKVSTYLWDNITRTNVQEYSAKDVTDGYVTDVTINPETGIRVSYPKFTTKFGTYISFKSGIWNRASLKYDSARLKVINVPVLKSHFIYGVTGCVKHYMGVVSDKLTAELGGRSHTSVGKGGIGTEMAGTRLPMLNIMDAIWVNAKPVGGPKTPYDVATRVDIILAGTDPVAIDYWASKNILMQTAMKNGHTELTTLNPDYTESNCFGTWLRLSMEEIKKAGHQATIEESHMNVYVAEDC
jgi:hypothetical protein